MSAKERKREIVRAYKERPAAVGVYAVRCAEAGKVWVAASRHVDTQKNGLWFGLSIGNHVNKAMQAVWTQFGEAAFVYEVLERLSDEDLEPYVLTSRLKDREAYWIEALDATRAVG